jgi:hypothetical protein
VPQREQYAPKHRGAHAEPALKKGIKKSVVFSGVAVAATGIAVSGGIVIKGGAPTDASSAALASAVSDHSATITAADLAERTTSTSRSDRRTSVDETKVAGLDQQSGGASVTSEDLSDQDPRLIAQALLPQFGFDSSQFGCLDALYMSESGWDVHADNPTSSAYGIPQALPGEKMAGSGPDWQNNAETQIRWGLSYIQSRYGTPCSAWAFKQGHNWY